MELEFQQLDLRYDRLRARQPARERRLLASLADAGLQTPIVVVIGRSAYVVVDGHKHVRCLRQLHRDTVVAVLWEMSDADPLTFASGCTCRRSGSSARPRGASGRTGHLCRFNNPPPRSLAFAPDW
jgi:hypothetical protein